MSRARHRKGGGRLDMVASGNPDVIKEAEGKEPYAEGDEKKSGDTAYGKKRGGRAKHKRASGGKVLGLMTGGPVKHRSDRAAFRHGGKVSAHHDGHEIKMHHGSMTHHRPGRKRGGAVGSDLSPLTTANRKGASESHPKEGTGGYEAE